MVYSAEDLIDLKKHRIERIDTAEGKALLDRVRGRLAAEGCAVLKGFIRKDKLAALVGEADRASVNAHRSCSRTNAYFSRDDESLPDAHPKRRFFDRSNAFIPADNFADDSGLRAIYRYPPLFEFLKAALEADQFHRYADPLADVIVNMAEEGDGFPWHFDTNNYTVTLALQNATAGGDFEYAPDIRKGDENFEEVTRVLDGASTWVRTLRLEPGDLQIFKGRYSLHRVAPLKGTVRRYVAIFSYVEEPGMVGSVERMLQLYGKTLPIHHERAGRRADAYMD